MGTKVRLLYTTRTIKFNGTLSKEDAKSLRSAAQIGLQNVKKN